MTGAALRRLQDGDSGPAHRPYLETVGRVERRRSMWHATKLLILSVTSLVGLAR
jgi:hypothetical protein